MRRALAALFVLALAGVSGAETPRLLATDTADLHSPAVSPDGRWIVFVREDESGHRELRRLRLDRTDAVAEPFFPHPATSTHPVFSPDGRRIAFQTTRADAFGDVMVAEFPSGRAAQLYGERGVEDWFSGWSSDWSAPLLRPQPAAPAEAPPFPPRWFSQDGRLAIVPTGQTPAEATTAATLGELWQGPSPWRPVATEVPGLHSACAMPRGGFVVSARRNGRLVLYRIEANPSLAQTPAEALRSAAREPRAELRRALLCLAAAGTDAPSREEAALALARELLAASMPTEALQALALRATDDDRTRLVRATAERDAVLGRSLSDGERTAALARAGAAFAQLSASAEASVRCMALLEQARTAALQGATGDALELSARAQADCKAESDGTALRELLLLRADVFETLDFAAEAETIRLRVLRDFPGTPEARRSAAQILSRASAGADPDERRRAIRAVAARMPESADLQAAAVCALVSSLRDQGALLDAAATVAEALTSARLSPEARTEFTELRMDLLASAGRVTEAASLALEARTSGTLVQVSPALLRRLLDQGRQELQLGDAALARRTFERVLALDGRSVEAWRGVIAVDARNETGAQTALRDARESLRRDRRDALAWYRVGLIESYRQGRLSAARKALERAVTLEPGEPYFHQTLGFVYESLARTDADAAAMLGRAVSRYETALALLPTDAPAQAAGDLHLNLGNVALAEDRAAVAYRAYRRRAELRLPFENAMQELLFLRNRGIASFRAGRAAVAAGHFAEALDHLASTPAESWPSDLTPARREALRRELLERRALAATESGRLDEADRIWAELITADSAPSRRLLRNRALNALLRAEAASPVDRPRLAAEVIGLVDAAERAPHASIAGTPPRRGTRAWITMNMTMAANPVSGAADLDISEDDEGTILVGLRARATEMAGSDAEVTAALDDGIRRAAMVRAADPAAPLDAEAAYRSRRAALPSTLPVAAMRDLAETIRASRFDLQGVPTINGPAVSHAMLQFTEAALHADAAAVGAALSDTWVWRRPRAAAAEPGAYAQLGFSAEALCEDTVPGLLGATPAIVEPLARVRLRLAAALAYERAAHESPDVSSTGIDALRFAIAPIANAGHALANARLVDAEALTAPGSEELARLRVQARAVAMRVHFAAGRQVEALTELRTGQAIARESGLAVLEGWLAAQAALFTSEASARVEHARAARDRWMTLLPGEWPPSNNVPWALIDSLESIDVGPLVDSDDFEAAWNATEAWRALRLRLLFRDVDHRDDGGGADDWAARAASLRGRVNAWRRDLGNLGALETTRRAALLAERNRLAAEWDSLAADGVDSGVPLALLAAAQPGTAEDASVAFDLADVLGQSLRLELRRDLPGLSATLVLESPAASEVTGEAPISLVLGEPGHPRGANELHLLSTNDLLRRLDALAVRLPDSPAWRTEGSAPIGEAARLDLGQVQARGSDATLWRTASGQTAALLIAQGDSATEIDVAVDAGHLPGPVAELALAGVASLGPAAQVRIARSSGAAGTRAWLAPMLDAAIAPDRATDELDAARGTVIAASEARDPARALRGLDRMMALQRALGIDEDLTLLETLRAQALVDLRRHADAVEALRSAIESLPDDAAPATRADLERRLGNALSQAGRADDAAATLSRAAASFAAQGDRTTEAETVAEAGIAFENAGRAAPAREAFQRALDLANELGEPLLAARQARRLARVALLLEADFERAIEDARTAQRLAAEAVPEQAREADLLRANAQLDEARAFERLGRYADSLAATDTVTSAALLLGNETLRAEALLHRANVLWLRADYLESFNARREGLALAETLGDDPLRIGFLNVGALMDWSLNDLDRAWPQLDRALEVARRSRLDREVATTHNNRGLIRRSQSRFPEALAEFEAALAIDTRQGTRWGMAYSLRNIGLTHLQAGNTAAAIDPLRRALALATEIGDRLNAAKASLGLGDALRLSGDLEGARREYRATLDAARSLAQRDLQWRATFGLSQLAAAQADTTAQRQFLEETLVVLEDLRARLRIEEFQDGFLADKQHPYDDLVRLLLDAGDAAGAWAASERARGRNFIDLLGNAGANPGAPADRALLDQERTLRDRIESLERRAATRPGPAVAEELADARRAYADLLVSMRGANPALGGFIRVEAASLAEVQALLEPETRLLVYHLLPAETVCWVVGPQSLQVYRQPVARGTLAGRVEGLRRRLQDFEPVDRELADLGRILVAEPIGQLPPTVRRVGIIPHRELHAMPFAALAVADRPVIERVAVYYAPSASVLRYTVARRTRPAEASNRVLAIGNPDLRDARLDLPFAQKEVERLPFQFPEARVALGAEATESWLVDNIADYAIVHIASHGEYDPNQPLFSAVKLAGDARNDGSLSAREVFSLSIRADLVTLSACQTGLGRLTNGDDIIGLNRSFVFAGTRQLLTSLWRVDDISTAVLIKHFYRFASDQDRAQALRSAQLRIRSSFPHPAHWSGMVLSGDWQ